MTAGVKNVKDFEQGKKKVHIHKNNRESADRPGSVTGHIDRHFLYHGGKYHSDLNDDLLEVQTELLAVSIVD